ncbi:MAG: EAL domain-containing protein [Gammaproteobacteria bacterium]|jgi:EAL domain-containing protein (putative c-di-GMP-specific phosphodiesterase class I)/PleD family two-component response regulator
MQERNSILFLGEGRAAAEYVRWLVNAGMDVKQIHDPSGLGNALQDNSPVAVIIDLGGDTDAMDLLARVAAAIGEQKPLRVIFISNRADQEVRLRAVQAGGDAFLTRPLTPQLLMRQLDPVLFAGQREYRVLLIGKMPSSMTGVAEQFEVSGMKVKRLVNPSQALLSVINFSPDLLIIAPLLPDCRGDELAQVLHQFPDYEDLPVILLGDEGARERSKHTDPASEWLPPDSMNARELVAHIGKRIDTARAGRKQQLYLQALDPDTGLLNRQGFVKALERGIAATDTMALVHLDLGNIQHQYPALDPHTMQELMVMVANQLEKLAEPAELAARTGDSAFTFLVSRKTQEEIRKLGKLLSQSIASRFFNVGQNSLVLGSDTGVAFTRSSLDNGMPLFLLALKACEEARRAGSNRVSIRSLEAASGRGRDEQEHRVLELLREACSSGHFRLVFQPIVSLRGNTVEKYEVLLRLLDTDNEFIYPSRFVAVAERYGLMQSIDRWVVEQTISTLKKRGRGTRFFNKVSSSTLRDDEFVDFVQDCIAQHGISGEQLVFEISRSNITSGIDHVTRFADGIRPLGCGISVEHGDISKDIDPLLEHLPASYVKLDGSVVKDLCKNPDRQEHLATMVRQAEQHDVRVIAACIESANCLQVLWQSGVHYIQGNFLQEPAAELDFDFGS